MYKLIKWSSQIKAGAIYLSLLMFIYIYMGFFFGQGHMTPISSIQRKSCLCYTWLALKKNLNNDDLVQDCSNSSANALELLQSCPKPLICNQSYITSFLNVKPADGLVMQVSPTAIVQPSCPTILTTGCFSLLLQSLFMSGNLFLEGAA